MEDNTSVDVLEAAKRRAEAQAEAQRKKLAQCRASKEIEAARYVLKPLGDPLPQPKFQPQKKTFSFRIEAFRSFDNDKAEIYNAIVDGSGPNLLEATSDAVEKLKRGEAQYNRIGT